MVQTSVNYSKMLDSGNVLRIMICDLFFSFEEVLQC